MKLRKKMVTILAISAMLAAFFGCATHQKETYSGFLKNYPPFESGQKGIDKRYLKQGVDFRQYDKILMEEVVFFLNDDADYKGIHPDEIKKLSDEFHKIFAEEMGDLLTAQPGPRVTRMRMAVTKLQPSKPVSGATTTVIPVGLALSIVKKGATGNYIGIGSASMEVEFLDSITNERIAAAVDRAPGGKFDIGKLSAAKSAFKFWAKRLHAFMNENKMAKY
jgi:hypothetical protein